MIKYKEGEKLGKYKICVYAICKNEEQFVERWMNAVSEADMVVVTDTGSSDETVERLRKRGAIVYRETIVPWRFDTARNIALSHIPEDIDICVSNDLDEIFEPGWRDKLEKAWLPGSTRARYLFTWSYNSDGSPNKQYEMEKIHSRHGYRWIRPVHEFLKYVGEGIEKEVRVNDLVLNHYPDLNKSRGQYLPLLELSAKENSEDDRIVFWLGREYLYYGQYEACIQTLKKHLAMPSASWDEERCASMRFIAQAYQQQGDLGEAKKWIYRAVAECPSVREPYLQMAKLGYIEKNWSLVYHMTEEALKITQKTGSYLLEVEAWGYSLYDLGALACYEMGLYKKAYIYSKKACELEPGDERLKKNLEFIKQKQ